jgi:hypothetical protein
LRKLKAAGKDVTPKVGGGGGGNSQSWHEKRKSGGGKECHFYKRTGTFCKFGKDCKYDHVDGGKSGSSMMSKKDQKRG